MSIPNPFAPAHEWTPGDPLYSITDHQHSRYLFNFRDDSEGDDCRCGDAADWPAQTRRPIAPIGQDELEDFIRDWHVWRGGAA